MLSLPINRDVADAPINRLIIDYLALVNGKFGGPERGG